MLILDQVSIVAVVIAAIANMALGMVWYSEAAFGKTWMKLNKITKKDIENADMRQAFGLGFIATLLMCYVIAILLAVVQPASVQHAMNFGFLLWLGLNLPPELHGMAWERRPMKLLLINSGNALVTILMTVVILMTIA